MPERAVDSAVLGRLLILHTGLAAAPDERRLAGMVAHALVGMPGVAAATVCLEGVRHCADGQANLCVADWRGTTSCERCGYCAVGDWERIEVRTARAEYGTVLLRLGDRASAEPYLPHFANTTQMVALHLENRRADASQLVALERLDQLASERAVLLRDSEERFRLAMEASQDGLWDWDVASGAVYFSPAYAAMLGYTPDELDPRVLTWESLVHPADRAEAVRVNQACIAGELDSFAVEFRMLSRSGQWRWILGRGKAVGRDGEGRATRLIGTHTDITERRRIEEAGSEARRLLRNVLDTVTVRVFWKDTTGRYLGCNLPFARDAGFTDPADVVGLTDYDTIWTPEAERYRADDREVLASGEAKIGYEEPQTEPDGRRRWVRTSKVPLRDADGQVVGVLGTYEDVTERREAEEALRESEAVFRGLFYDHAAAKLLIDPADGRIVDANSAATAYYGYSREQMQSMTVGELNISPPAQVLQNIQRAASQQQTVFEFQHGLADGSVRDVVVFSSRVQMKGRALLYSIIHDATERKQAEAALRDSEERYRRLFEANPQPMWVLDAENLAFLAVNEATVRHYGYSAAEFSRMTAADVVVHEQWDQLRHAVSALVSGPEGHISHWKHVRRDGSVIDVEAVRHAMDYQGRAAVLVLATDITARKQAEEALRDSEERYRLLFDSNPQPMFVLDMETTAFLAVNTAAVRQYGYSEAEFLSMTAYDLRGPEDYAGMRAAVSGAADGGPGNVGQWTHRRRDGSRITVEIVRHAIDYQGRLAVLVLATDVTERLRAEEARAALERQLQHAQKLESLGVLAGGIAHDFNNLLMAILGNADLALEELSPMSPARDNIVEIERASRRAADLAKQMLAYSGKGRFVVESIRLGELVEEMGHLLEVSISKHAVLKYNFAANLPTFQGDATQVRQVIMNLITNASEAIGETSGVIALSTGAMECDREYLNGVDDTILASLPEPLPEGVYVYVEVADTGCGMSPEVVERIFDPFFTTKFTGRGLGMSAVLGIVRGHKGAIKVYSELGRGTTFKVLFPVDELLDGGARARRAGAGDEAAWRGTGTVMVVDDEETVRAVGRRMLERMGFTVLTAPHGVDAVSQFRDHADEVVCVLLDLTMPHMDGEETFRELRRIRGDVRVVLCSGYNEQDATQRFSGKGLASFLQKPYNLATLRETMASVLGIDS